VFAERTRGSFTATSQGTHRVGPYPELVTGSLANLLVIDDEESIADLVSSALRFAGYNVATENNGFDALRRIKRDVPDLIVLDVNMPEIDGFEVCRRIRRDGIDVPVIFLTARDDITDLRTGFRQGGDDYLTKPFSLEELGLRIEALLRRAGAEGETGRIAAQDVVIDDQAHQVWRSDQPILLSPTEFRLLRFLVLNQGRVMSKPQIVEHVWDYDFDGNYGIVETYVSYLRKKLGDADASLVQTVRGVGYVIRSEANLP
jgi:two-component system, OmpR family, response regulator